MSRHIPRIHALSDSSSLVASTQDPFYQDSRWELCVAQFISTDTPGPSLSSLQSQVVIRYIRENPASTIDEVRMLAKDIYNHVQRWTGLQGPGSVPIIGTTFDRRLPALITPYYRNGNVIDFVKAHPAANKLKIILQIAETLQDLHKRGLEVCHGNIRASHILINDEGNALLSDSGLAAVLSSDLISQWRWWSQSTILQHCRDDMAFKPSQKKDVYSFAMTIIQIFTGDRPFPLLRDMPGTIYRIVKQGLPLLEKPSAMDEKLWKIVAACLEDDECRRPNMTIVTARLREYMVQSSFRPSLRN